MVCACEDVGLAYPQIIPIVKAAVDAANMLGLPRGPHPPGRRGDPGVHQPQVQQRGGRH